MGRKKKVFDLMEFKSNLKSTKGQYVPNSALLEELIKSHELGELTETAALMFMAIATKLNDKRCFNYKCQEDKDDCISYAIMDCCLYWKSFDIVNGTNPFAYFTAVCTNGLAKGWNRLGYMAMPHSKRVSINSDNLYTI
jgi:hypothetical protein